MSRKTKSLYRESQMQKHKKIILMLFDRRNTHRRTLATIK